VPHPTIFDEEFLLIRKINPSDEEGQWARVQLDEDGYFYWKAKSSVRSKDWDRTRPDPATNLVHVKMVPEKAILPTALQGDTRFRLTWECYHVPQWCGHHIPLECKICAAVANCP